MLLDLDPDLEPGTSRFSDRLTGRLSSSQESSPLLNNIRLDLRLSSRGEGDGDFLPRFLMARALLTLLASPSAKLDSRLTVISRINNKVSL